LFLLLLLLLFLLARFLFSSHSADGVRATLCVTIGRISSLSTISRRCIAFSWRARLECDTRYGLFGCCCCC
jgi:hypothetical protein